MSIDLQRTIHLTECRCYSCHRWFAHEASEKAECPHCAKDRMDDLLKTIQELRNSVAAYKGQIKRLKTAQP